MPKKKTDTDKKQEIQIKRLGAGSAEYVKTHDTSGLFYFEDEEHNIIFWDKKNNNIKEQKFDTFEKFSKYITKTYGTGDEE